MWHWFIGDWKLLIDFFMFYTNMLFERVQIKEAVVTEGAGGCICMYILQMPVASTLNV